jgi:7-cyano-7-deazaguanine synthase
VVLLSGGLDSYTAAAAVAVDGYRLDAITVRYGQTHEREVAAARRVAASLGVDRHVELEVDLSAFGGSSLVGDGEIPTSGVQPGIPSTYVPARNTVFLALALAFAESRRADAIVIGVNAVDYSGYPDCRPEYIAAFERMAALATRTGVEGHPIRILTPLQQLTKGEIIRLGMTLGLDYGLTHSCYAANAAAPCGVCDSCRLRAKGFAEAGVRDPLL